ncbi:MAG: hypothetical protein VB042_02990 [Victivallaceae bacterium]|nr:hypothetical protein [Victivallaceae bacterium]
MKRFFYLLIISLAINVPAYTGDSLEEEQITVKICKAFDDTDNIFYCFSLSPEGYEQNSFTCSGNGISYVYEPWNALKAYDTAGYGGVLFVTKPGVPYVWCYAMSDRAWKDVLPEGNRIFKMHWRYVVDPRSCKKETEIFLWDGKGAPDFHLDADKALNGEIIKLLDGSAYSFALVIKNGTDYDYPVPQYGEIGNQLTFVGPDGHTWNCDDARLAWSSDNILAPGETACAKIDIGDMFKSNNIIPDELPEGVYTMRWQLADNASHNTMVKEFYYYQPEEIKIIDIDRMERVGPNGVRFYISNRSKDKSRQGYYYNGRYHFLALEGEYTSRFYISISKKDIKKNEVAITILKNAYFSMGTPLDKATDGGRIIGKQTIKFKWDELPLPQSK